MRRAVNDPHVGRFLDIPKLRGGKLTVRNDEVDLVIFAEISQLLQTAAAEEGAAVGLVALLAHPADDLCAGGLRQFLKLIE